MILLYILTFLIGFLSLKVIAPEINNKCLIAGLSINLGILIEAFCVFILMFLNIDEKLTIIATLLCVLVLLIYCGGHKLISGFKKCPSKFCDKPNEVRCEQNFGVVTLKGEQQVGLRGARRAGCDTRLDIFDNPQEQNIATQASDDAGFDKPNKFIIIAFIAIILLSFVLLYLHVKKEPEGAWDAMFIWNMRAKFFYVLHQLNMDWRLFYNSLIDWTHPDYPILLPAYNYANHIMFGTYNNLINLITSFVVLLGVIISLIGGVKEFRGINNALIAGIVLICSKPFLWESITQCADVFLSLFILNSFICLFLHEKYKNNLLLFASFLFAASCAFCKNEGILFFAIFSILSVFFIKKKSIKTMMYACCVPILCLLYTKLFIYSKSDLFVNQNLNAIVIKLTDLNRYKFITINYINNLFNMFFPVVAIILVSFTKLIKDRNYINIKIMLLCMLILIFLGYNTVYLLTPRDLIWHLETSSMRLFVQYIPLIILGIFMTFNCCDMRK